ncbi:DUF551 domain-containing protein [Klebsiella aerogenes]|uniref:DUF551 domain-containing protein n=1 Tax=Klebsiella aerogenes TaxID=548 RepID=UPI00069BDC2B|nr:DUF551 domain-containing protein [Klebsiella aerogenes]
MTKSTITREHLQEIAEDGFLKHGESKELARMALAAMDSEPVAWGNGCDKTVPAALRYLAENERPFGGESRFNAAHLYQLAREIELMAEAPLYRHAQPATVTERDPIAWLNDAYLARGVVDGEAGSEDAGPGYIPVYREAGPQPAPVVSDDLLSMAASAIEDLLEHTDPNTSYYSGVWADVPGKLRAAMLQAGSSPAQSDCCPAQNHASPEQNGDTPAQSQGWIQVSEQMPEDEQEVLTINRMGHRFVSFFDKHSGLFFDRIDAPAACCIEHVLVTHWMPLPNPPKEEK